MDSLNLEQLAQVAPERRTGMWIAWYRGRALSTHADYAVLVELMAAEGLADVIWYTHDDDDRADLGGALAAD